MSKKELKKEIKRLNKIIDALIKGDKEEQQSSVTTTYDYIGGRPNDRG